ncbi:uncharacterized protein SEPMUDRAFT_163518 [Sphaerulina musiva SO2202]|uniref:Uncharacterized protein n=1 Tax=Sphaerulina musiva (strain SO2202) TaxID=692275 RepID=M3B2G3_SPHMS|nr:uncharacterized protein SEPMUDRAFT_163518 [Sphaerulina musiva SO2202]EMF13942.1 hypothetical protein SEPMUDRAFT_163518 [Sphaerulina musiva SO2202]
MQPSIASNSQMIAAAWASREEVVVQRAKTDVRFRLREHTIRSHIPLKPAMRTSSVSAWQRTLIPERIMSFSLLRMQLLLSARTDNGTFTHLENTRRCIVKTIKHSTKLKRSQMIVLPRTSMEPSVVPLAKQHIVPIRFKVKRIDKNEYCYCGYYDTPGDTTGPFIPYDFITSFVCLDRGWAAYPFGPDRTTHCANNQAFDQAQSFADDCFARYADGALCCQSKKKGCGKPVLGRNLTGTTP